MTDISRTAVVRRRTVYAGAVLLGLLAGCGTGPATPPDLPAPVITGAPPVTTAPTTAPAPTTTAPTTTAPTTHVPTGTTHAPATRAPSHRAAPRPSPAPTAAPGPVRLLPWPTTNQARLQATADGGGEPWLLDPTDLALSYVAATYGWNAATATPAAGTAHATAVAVRNTDGSARRLTVAQPHRTGPGGIWLVTADAKG